MGDRLSSIFTVVLNMTITASYVTLALLVLRVMLYKRLPKLFFYSLWGVVLIRLMIPFSFTSAMSFLKVFNPATTNQGMVVSYLPQYENNHMIPSIDLSVEQDNSFQGALIETNKAASLMSGLAATWIVGVMICFAISVISYVKVGRKLRTAYLDERNVVLEQCKKFIGVRKAVKVFRSDQVETPIVMGILKPRIILPINIVAEEELYSILLHELVHIKRMDYMIRPLSLIALILHWFNPFVWVAFFLAGRDMELSCDERVLNLQGETFKSDYAKVLLTIAMRQNNLSPMGLLAFGEGNTKKRIKSIMAFKKQTIGIVVVTVLICILTGVMLLSNPPKETAQEPMQEPDNTLNTLQVNRESKVPNEPPEITVVCDTNLGTYLNVIVQKNKWNNAMYDRPSFYQALWKSDYAMTNLARPKEGSKFTIDFGEYKPDKVSVQMEYITESLIASELPTHDIEVTYDGTYYTFVHPKMIETDIGTSGRFYAITASWGEDECEYAFAVDGKFDQNEIASTIGTYSMPLTESGEYLSEQEKKIYMKFKDKFDESVLKDVSPISIAKFYVQAALEKDYDTQYALYIDYEEADGEGWSKAEDYQIPQEDRMKELDIYRYLVPLTDGIFVDKENHTGYIRYTMISPSGEEVETGFNMQKNKTGIWKVCFMPIQ